MVEGTPDTGGIGDMKGAYTRAFVGLVALAAVAAQLGTIVWGNHIIWGD
jgi:hypothetical protein